MSRRKGIIKTLGVVAIATLVIGSSTLAWHYWHKASDLDAQLTAGISSLDQIKAELEDSDHAKDQLQSEVDDLQSTLDAERAGTDSGTTSPKTLSSADATLCWNQYKVAHGGAIPANPLEPSLVACYDAHKK